MATLEIDPILRKGFKLLQSRTPDSTEKLKALLDEEQRKRHNGKTGSIGKDPFNLRKESPIPRSKPASPSGLTLSKGNDLKRDQPHSKRDDEIHLMPKRPRMDSPHSSFKSHTPSPTPSLKSESSSKSRKSDESDSEADMNDFTMEIGINCTVCKSFEQTSGNRLVECQDCHSLYHQECHKPSVSHQDITDPRLVWYCAKCSRNNKKRSNLIASSGTQSTSSSSLSGVRSASSPNAKSSFSTSSRPSPSKGISGIQRTSPFSNLSSASQRSIGSTSTSSVSSSSTRASTSTSSVSSSSTRASTSTSSVSSSSTRASTASRNASAPPAANSIMNAERRVHLMKKKAAKNAERRKIM